MLARAHPTKKPPQDETRPASGSESVPRSPAESTGRLHPRGAFTSGLSKRVPHAGQAPKCQGILILEQASRLGCFFSGYPSQNGSNRPYRWRDNWHTRGPSTQVLSYYGQASSEFPTSAEDRDQTVSHDVLNPAAAALIANSRTSLGPAPAPGCDEPTSRCQNHPVDMDSWE